MSLLQLVDAQAIVRDRLERRVRAAAEAELRKFDGWYRPELVEEFAQRLAAIVEAGQRSTAQVTDAYLARAASELARTVIGPAGMVDQWPLRHGVDMAEVYARPAVQYRWQRSRGRSNDEALALAALRLGKVLSTDLALAVTHQSRRFMLVHRTDGFRRIVHPERSRTGACGLCLVAADRIYSRKDLLPIHAECRCEVLPIINGQDPAGTLNLSREQLEAIYAAGGGTAGSTKGSGLKSVRVRIDHHSEVGPTLVAA